MGNLTTRIGGMKVEKGSLAIFWLSQGNFVFKTEHGNIMYIDPYLSNSVQRVYGQKGLIPIPIPPEEVRADLVVITHDHLDHLGPDTILSLSKVRNGRFLGPLSCVYHLLEIKIDKDRIIQMNRRETKVVEDMKISVVHSEHTEDSVGYVFDFDGIEVYISEDTKNHEKLIQRAESYVF